MDTTTDTTTTAQQPFNALAAFQQRAAQYQADKAEAARKAKEEAERKAREETEKAAKTPPAAKTPNVPPADQRPREREWIVPLAAVPTLQRVRAALTQAGGYDETLKRELWDAIERELDTCPLARAEFHREKVVEGLKRLSSRFLPWDLVERICKMRVGREVTQEEAAGLIEAKAAWKAHGKEMEGKEGHDPKKCPTCQARPADVFRCKRPTGPNSQQDFNFIIQRGGELEPYAKLVYGELKGWQTRSYEARENREALHQAFGVTPGKTLADVAAGNCPGCVVSAYIPRHLAVETTGRDGRSYHNFGEFFVYQMTEEELKDMGIRLPATGAAALQLVFPNNERESEMYREASKMAFVALGFGDVYSYSIASPSEQPFYGMRAHHNGREYAATNRGGINLRDVLVRGLPRKEGTVEEVVQAAQDVNHVLEEMQELVPQSQPRSHDGFSGSPRFQKGSRQEGRRHKGGRQEEDGRRQQNPQHRGY